MMSGGKDSSILPPRCLHSGVTVTVVDQCAGPAGGAMALPGPPLRRQTTTRQAEARTATAAQPALMETSTAISGTLPESSPDDHPGS